jgi:hypothetical protein
MSFNSGSQSDADSVLDLEEDEIIQSMRSLVEIVRHQSKRAEHARDPGEVSRQTLEGWLHSNRCIVFFIFTTELKQRVIDPSFRLSLILPSNIPVVIMVGIVFLARAD